MKKKIALVTGANRGIGFETSLQLAKKGFIVILGCRDEIAAENAKVQLRSQSVVECDSVRLDISDPESIARAKTEIHDKYGRLDVLVNNAAVFLDPSSKGAPDLGERSVLKARPEAILQTYQVNTIGPMLLMQAFVPKMRENGFGRIVNVSSGDGQLSDMNGGKPAYRLSKVSLNALTRIFADELKGTNVLVNSVCPGWVKTRMGGPNAKLEVTEAVGTIVWLAATEEQGPQGGFFRSFKQIAW